MATPPKPVPIKPAAIKPATGTPPAGFNTKGKIIPKTAPAPKGKSTNPARPDVKNTHAYLDSVKTKDDIKSEWGRLSDELKTANDTGNKQRAMQIKDAQAGLADKANAAGLTPKDMPLGTVGMDVKTAEGLGAATASLEGALEKRAYTKAMAQMAALAKAKKGGYAMKRKKVGCFKAGDKTKNKIKEYDRQLADQEKGINDMTVQEYLDGRAKYEEIGRQGTGAAQQKARADYAADLTNQNKAALNKQGITGAAASQQAAQMTASKMNTLAALHNPDMIAGGKDVIGGMGDKGVNSSIGGQWKDKVKDLDAAAKDVPEADRKTTKMSVKLERCP